MNIELTSVKPQQKDMDHRTDSMALYESRDLIVLDNAMIDGDILRSIATLRVYGGKSRQSSRRIASFWLSIPYSSKRGGAYARASGSASGGGYCRQSAAASEAMHNAGLTFDAGLHGVGMNAIDSALEAIARFYGYSVFHIARG